MSNINWKRKKKRIHIRPEYKLKSFYGYTIYAQGNKELYNEAIHPLCQDLTSVRIAGSRCV